MNLFDLPLRLASKISPEPMSGCWLWTGALAANGYSSTTRGAPLKGQTTAHRRIYELLVGEVPAGLDLDHLCRTRGCVNPAHLEPVTRSVNLLRGQTLNAAQAARTHCPRGHELVDPNLYRWRGHKQCRTCMTDLKRQRRQERRNR